MSTGADISNNIHILVLQSPCFLNKIIGILENHSESFSFSLSLQEKRGIEKKRETQNDSLECQYIYSKSPGSGTQNGDTEKNRSYLKYG